MRLDKDWVIGGHKFADPGRKDTIKACIYVKELVRFLLWKTEVTGLRIMTGWG